YPHSKWLNILRGSTVNLNKVLSSLHWLQPPKENSRHLGDVEISIGQSKPTCRIRTQAEWSLSSNQTIKAYTFVFPHCWDELVEYG
ncbi:hypothetical protein BJ165DRAFT_1359154, partial [Panaeolus papilionaceus]